MAHPPHGIQDFSEFKALKEKLPDAFWTAHGFFDIHALFMKLVKDLGISEWLFTSNLGQRRIF